MPTPGDYLPDSSEGIDDVDDLPNPIVKIVKKRVVDEYLCEIKKYFPRSAAVCVNDETAKTVRSAALYFSPAIVYNMLRPEKTVTFFQKQIFKCTNHASIF
ncbi:MAG: hypothetical protein ACRC2T_10070 [Thermoguttaceae bacterium]